MSVNKLTSFQLSATAAAGNGVWYVPPNPEQPEVAIAAYHPRFTAVADKAYSNRSRKPTSSLVPSK